jgi:hypothetical protein
MNLILLQLQVNPSTLKTAYKRFHLRMLVPYDKFEDGKAKNFYVGVRTLDGGQNVDVISFISR